MTLFRNSFLLSALTLGLASVSAQETLQTPAGPRSLRLDAVVAAKNGPPTTGLRQSDFTVLDNDSAALILSFKEVTSKQMPVRVILVIDAVNINFERVAYTQNQVQKFLRASEGRLAQPTTLAILTDKGMEMEKTFTTDGNVLSASLDHHAIGLRAINRSSGFWGADERVQISLNAAQQLTAFASTLPGRKIVVWVSPGWPLLSGARVNLSSKQQQQIFSNVVAFSQHLQKADVTLYDVNPLGPDESLFRSDYYQSFLNGVRNADQTDLADLSLQVLAIQSGGLALNNNDVSANIAKCISDASFWYQLTLALSPGDKPNEYHRLEIKVNQPGLFVRTRDGYYAEP